MCVCVHCVTGDPEVIALAQAHVLRLREKPWFRNSLLFICLEGNMDWTKSNRYGEMFQSARYGPGPVYIVRRDPTGKNRMGTWTDENTKQHIADHLMRSFVCNQIVYAKEFNSVDEAGFKREFETQVKNFRREYKVQTNAAFQKPKEVVTGKDRSGNRKDDIIMAWGIVMDSLQALTDDPNSEFMQLARRNNWPVPTFSWT